MELPCPILAALCAPMPAPVGPSTATFCRPAHSRCPTKSCRSKSPQKPYQPARLPPPSAKQTSAFHSKAPPSAAAARCPSVPRTAPRTYFFPGSGPATKDIRDSHPSASNPSAPETPLPILEPAPPQFLRIPAPAQTPTRPPTASQPPQQQQSVAVSSHHHTFSQLCLSLLFEHTNSSASGSADSPPPSSPA